MKGTARQQKGLRGEREVAAIFEQAGASVRGLESMGDQLIVCANGLTLHSEVKRQERLKLPEWIRQADAETPPGALAVVSFRQSRQPWRSVLLTSELAKLVTR